MNTTLWSDFLEHRWQKSPCVIESGPPLVSDSDVMNAIVTSFERLMAQAGDRDDRSGLRFFADGRQVQLPEYGSFLPQERTLADYIHGVTERIGGSSFGVIVDTAHIVLPDLFPRCKEFVQPLIDRVGVPQSNIETAIFAGNYRATPFGIHQDPGNAVFTFPVLGRKRFLLWPPDFFHDDPLSIYVKPDPADHEKAAIVIEVEPGQIAYWPEDWYHVGFDERNEPHAAFSIGTWREGTPAQRLYDEAKGFLETEFKAESFDVHTNAFYPPSDALPAPVSDALQAFESAVTDGRFRKYVERRWQKRIRDAGYGKVPNTEPPPRT